MERIKFASQVLLEKRLLSYSFAILVIFSLSCCAHHEIDKNHSANHIYIKSIPKAKIFANGDYVGKTPNKKFPAVSGSIIKLIADGYQTCVIKLGEVQAGKLSVKKARGHGGLSISSEGLTIKLKKKK